MVVTARRSWADRAAGILANGILILGGLFVLMYTIGILLTPSTDRRIYRFHAFEGCLCNFALLNGRMPSSWKELEAQEFGCWDEARKSFRIYGIHESTEVTITSEEYIIAFGLGLGTMDNREEHLIDPITGQEVFLMRRMGDSWWCDFEDYSRNASVAIYKSMRKHFRRTPEDLRKDRDLLIPWHGKRMRSSSTAPSARGE